MPSLVPYAATLGRTYTPPHARPSGRLTPHATCPSPPCDCDGESRYFLSFVLYFFLCLQDQPATPKPIGPYARTPETAHRSCLLSRAPHAHANRFESRTIDPSPARHCGVPQRAHPEPRMHARLLGTPAHAPAHACPPAPRSMRDKTRTSEMVREKENQGEGQMSMPAHMRRRRRQRRRQRQRDNATTPVAATARTMTTTMGQRPRRQRRRRRRRRRDNSRGRGGDLVDATDGSGKGNLVATMYKCIYLLLVYQQKDRLQPVFCWL
jgi:hypothetical protein